MSLNERVWERLAAGDPGAAFEFLWNLADRGSEQEMLATRAELQAFCGNEEAALRLASDVDDPGLTALIRAAVAAARGDWQTAQCLAAECLASDPNSDRAKSLLLRAELELESPERALQLVSELEASSPALRWDAALIQARAAADPSSALSTLAARARAEGAVLAEADAFAELGIVRQSEGDGPGACAAFVRAVELWDDMLMTLPPPLRSGFWSDARRQRARAGSSSPTGAVASASGSEEHGAAVFTVQGVGGGHGGAGEFG